MSVEEAIRHARVHAREMKIEAALTIAEVYEGEFLRRLHRDCAGEWSAAINGRSSMPALPHHEKGGQPRGANWASLIKPARNSFRVGQKNKAGPEEPEPA